VLDLEEDEDGMIAYMLLRRHADKERRTDWRLTPFFGTYVKLLTPYHENSYGYLCGRWEWRRR